MVADALTSEGWCFEKSRIRNQIITFLIDSMSDAQPILSSEVDDIYIWVTNGQNGSETFSTSEIWKTWKTLFPCRFEVFLAQNDLFLRAYSEACFLILGGSKR